MDIAIMGHGVVGSGVAEVLRINHDSIVKRSSQKSLDLKYILDLRDFPGDPNEDKFVKDFNIILNDDDVKIVVETMGGLHPAYEFVSSCLKAGKSVVTSNKELVAEKGCELLKIAKEKNVNFLFEASVGGGIPIIRPITQCLAANEFDAIAGILNGTTNFILTRMIDDNMDFADALKLAQDNGYAEKDPTADIEGHDTCRKICILAALCYGTHVYPKDVYTQGITGISLADIEYVNNWGGVVKLIGQSEKLDNGKITAMVSPLLIKNESPLSGVNDVFNAILVKGNAVGDTMFYGKGAGKLPTASAVVADIIDCAQHYENRKDFGWTDSKEDYVEDYKNIERAVYVRAEADSIDCIKEAFGDVTFLTRENAPEKEIAFVTPVMKEKDITEKLDKLPIKQLSFIRVSEF